MLTEAPKLAAFCLTEPGAGSDVSGMRTRAVRRGDKYVINGQKCFITNGGHADWFTVYAKTDPDAGHRGISAFVVDRDDTVIVDKKEDKMGQRASNTATITFNDTEVPAENLLGAENKGFKIAMATLDRTRPGVAAMAVGIARAAFEFAVDYSKQRVQFGVPIAMHQAIQFMIADMATEIEAARLLTWQSAVLLDQGARNTIQSSHASQSGSATRKTPDTMKANSSATPTIRASGASNRIMSSAPTTKHPTQTGSSGPRRVTASPRPRRSPTARSGGSAGRAARTRAAAGLGGRGGRGRRATARARARRPPSRSRAS